jgi:hypothetical protein
VAEQLLQSGGPLSTRAEKRSELAKTNANKVEQVSRLLAVGTAVGMRVTHTRDNGRECYGSYFSTVSNSDYLNLNSLRHSFEIVGADRRHEQRDRQHDKECQAAAFAPCHSLLITSAPSQSQLRIFGRSWAARNCPALFILPNYTTSQRPACRFGLWTYTPSIKTVRVCTDQAGIGGASEMAKAQINPCSIWALLK